jgi:hypothetical protein
MDDTGQSCAECLESVSTAGQAQNGASLCPQCAEQFYCTCAGCGGLIPQDEAVVRDGALCCVQCLTAPVSNDDAATLSDEALAALVAEFIRLHAEAKQLNERLDTIKEQLKRHAASQPRIANTVMLRTGEYAVKSPSAPSKSRWTPSWRARPPTRLQRVPPFWLRRSVQRSPR